MHLQMIDWVLLISYFVLAIVIGSLFTKKAGKSLTDYFVSGRSLPWWLAGTSMVATTFAADTPLAVAGMVANHGVAGNWLWWNMVMSGILTVFVFAKLWRRSGVITDIEFTELRYSGRAAAFLRGFRALYLGLPINLIIMGWVTLAMAKILGITLGMGKWEAVGVCLVITMVYSTLGGLWGVVVTDFIQFFIAMAGAVILAIFATHAVGGIPGLKQQLTLHYGSSAAVLSFVPKIGSIWMPMITFFVYLSVNWWATWYPGAEPGGGGYIAQRIFSAKNEKHSVLATLWFNIAQYALRSWPWIIVGLAAMVLYPNLADKESGYVKVMVDYLPSGWIGLMMAGFAAAYMSTISTQLNWGSSYLVNDFYRRFLNKNASEKHYVWISRLATILLLALAAIVTHYMGSIEKAWKFLLAIGAGTGSVYILRWFWWRISAWSEIAAMTASFVVSLLLQYVFHLNNSNPYQFAQILLITVAISTVVWLAVTFLTSPEEESVLIHFYKKVHPGGGLWASIPQKAGIPVPKGIISRDLLDWLFGIILIYTSLFGIGKFVLGEYGTGFLFLAGAAVSGAFIYRDLSRRGWEKVAE
ncbi:sodium/glucose cotransporter [bacterium BMS3Abin05]|nr:sodium/glucose cotransporter [bacterium BMS3Abin05]GBE27965.1 sodium/glucose cotransporter [bacterium BMS3Bbin03]